MECKDQFYSYAIFVSWVVVFFAVLAIFYSFMETGMLFPPVVEKPPPPNHIFDWMKQAAQTEDQIEPITDLTYRDNKKLEQNIANMNDPIYQVALNSLHMEELKEQNGAPYPSGLYYVEPFETMSKDLAKNVEKYENTLIDTEHMFNYGSGARFMENFYERLPRK